MSKAKCLQCDTILESKHRHDWVTCGCENETFIDGGDVYHRAGGHDLSMIQWFDDEGNPIVDVKPRSLLDRLFNRR